MRNARRHLANHLCHHSSRSYLLDLHSLMDSPIHLHEKLNVESLISINMGCRETISQNIPKFEQRILNDVKTGKMLIFDLSVPIFCKS